MTHFSRLTLPDDTRKEAEEAAAVLAAELHLHAAVESYAELAYTGGEATARALPTLHLDDVSAIPFLVDIAGVEEYQHRARVRAGDGDLFAASSEPAAGYEDYCREVLGMGDPELLLAGPGKTRLSVAEGLQAGPSFERLCARAREDGGLLVHPYMGIEDVWDLAAAVRAETGQEVRVLGPPPPVTWVANDKMAFSRLVELVLGEGWLVETHITTDPEAMAMSLRLLAHRHDRVGLKRTRCASAMGNIVFDSAEISKRSDAELRQLVEEFLRRTEWPAGEDVLAVAWEDTDISPSTQLWIPPRGRGAPVVEGIYEQILAGPEKVFVGSRPSGLPAAVDRTLAGSALEVATALQALGYVGRCSFDHLLVGDPEGEFRALFVECNGRWGGTSTPMSLLDRLLFGCSPGDVAAIPRRPAYRAQDVVSPALVGAALPDLLDRIGDAVFRPDTKTGRFIFYNVGPLARSGKLDVIALGRDQEDAERAMLEELPALLGI